MRELEAASHTHAQGQRQNNTRMTASRGDGVAHSGPGLPTITCNKPTPKVIVTVPPDVDSLSQRLSSRRLCQVDKLTITASL